MKVFLTRDVKGIGRAGDVKEVSDGHARNFLIPKGLAMVATQNLVAHNSKEKKEKEEKRLRDEQKLKDFLAKLNKLHLVIKAKASKDHLFAAVREDQIAQTIHTSHNIDIDPKLIEIPTPIKNLGPATANIKINSDLKALIHLEIQPQ